MNNFEPQEDNSCYFCLECYETLQRKSDHLARIWVYLCESFIKSGRPLSYQNGETTLLNYLEHEGYVTTTDNDKTILIRVNGMHQEEDDDPFFCLDYKYHQRKAS
jgi:hypothetical protein